MTARRRNDFATFATFHARIGKQLPPVKQKVEPSKSKHHDSNCTTNTKYVRMIVYTNNSAFEVLSNLEERIKQTCMGYK